ncbi:MAG: hypothetical protein FWG66_02925 [Spirochaetes bacterium]|nr:hypothetical protein [Spirochaetota bacterium]
MGLLDSSEKFAESQNLLNIELDTGAVEGLKKMPVDMFDGVYLGKVFSNALVLCVDLRNFSDFINHQDDEVVFKLIKEFTSNLLSCINQFGYGCSYYKFLGDGVLVIWDETNETTINEALGVFDTYTEFLNEELFKSYETLGLGGALVEEKIFKYEISAEVAQLKYRDYVGYGINLACRLQGLAGIEKLILNERIALTRGLDFTVDESPQTLKKLADMKGLKKEDSRRVLFYKKPS